MGQLVHIDPLKTFGGKKLYSFALIKLFESSGAYNLIEELTLRLNPTSISIDEPAATSFTPTFGGMNVETRGNLYKECSIQGDVGFLHTDEEQVLAPPEETWPSRMDRIASTSGYVDFHTLRNLFRRYWLIKAGDREGGLDAVSPKDRNAIRLVFFNYKDGEAWVVEPTMFSMPPRRKFSYQYNIRMRMLVPLDVVFEDLFILRYDRTRTLSDDIRTFMDNILGSIESIKNTVSTASVVLGSVLSVVQSGLQALAEGLDAIATVGNLPSQITRQWVSNLTNTVNNAIEAANRIAGVPAELIETLLYAQEQVIGVSATAEIFYESTTARYDRLRAQLRVDLRVAGAVVPSAQPGMDAMPSGVVSSTIIEGETIFDLSRRLLQDINRWTELVTLNNLQSPYVSSGYRKPGVLMPGDSILVPVSLVATTRDLGVVSADSTAEYPTLEGAIIMPDTILGDTFTFSVLGERLLIGAWIGFECTFTSDTGLTVTCSVLSNEDYSITVSHVPDAFFSLPVTWKLSVPAKWNTPEDYAYGFDLLKTGDGDLSFGFDNDFILLHGMRNFEQALDVKLNTESQSLPMHPWFGMLKNVGQRGDNATIVGVVTSFMRTLASDSRVAAVEGVKVGIDKDVLVIQAGIRSKLDNTVTVVGGSF